MKKIIYLGLIFSSSFLLSCWGTHTNTITIQTPFNPAPDLLVYHKLGSSAEDLTSNMGQPIVRTISYPETACIFSIFANAGSYNIQNFHIPAAGNGLPNASNNEDYWIYPQNTHPFQLTYQGSPGVIFSSGVMASTKKDMTIKYVNNAIYSWGNLPATGPFATATLPTPEIKTSFTIKDNLIDDVVIRYINSIQVNVSSGNTLSLNMQTTTVGCLSGMSNTFTIAEVQIAYQKFGTSLSPYQAVPSTLVQVTSDNLVANISLPQANIPYFNRNKPQPGIYYIKLLLTDPSRKYQVLAEISPAFVVWDL